MGKVRLEQVHQLPNFDPISRLLQAISKMQITFKDKARADEKAQHTGEYVSILKRLATPKLGVRCIFEMACSFKVGLLLDLSKPTLEVRRVVN